MSIKFPLGEIVITPGALEVLGNSRVLVGTFITRHAEENELSLKEGFRILSAYEYQGSTIWIITEADRSVTTILLPDEY